MLGLLRTSGGPRPTTRRPELANSSAAARCSLGRSTALGRPHAVTTSTRTERGPQPSAALPNQPPSSSDGGWGFRADGQLAPSSPLFVPTPAPVRHIEPPLNGGSFASMQSEDVSSDVGFGFSAGGLLFPYFLGVVSQLQAMGVLRHEVPVAGASAGSIIAVCAKSGLSEEQLFEALLDLAADCRQGGTRARLRHVLHRVLDSVLPADIHERCEGRAFLAVTNVWPRPQSELVSSFSSRDDLIDTVLTSCHIPYWFDGSLVRPYRNSIAFDGGITNFIPATPTDICHRVCCFPSANLSSFSIDLSPDTFDSDFPYDMRTLLSWAFEPAPDAMLAALLERGKRDARAWALANVPSSQLVMAA